MKATRISDYQFFFIIFVSVTSLTFFSVPLQLVSKVKQDLWLSMAIGTAVDLYVAAILAWLGNAYPGQSLVQYPSAALGKAAGKLVGAIFLLFFVGVVVSSLWIFSDFLARTLMPETPRFLFSTTMTLCAGWAASKGLETIARLAQLIGAVILIVSIIMFATSLPLFRADHLLPQFENGFGPAVKGSVYSASWFGICIMMGMLMPHQANPKRTFRMKTFAVLLGSSLMTLYLLYCIGVMGPYMAARLENPIYTFARITRLVIFERIEVLLLLVFITGTFITMSTLYFSVAEGVSQWLGERWRKASLYGFGVLFVLSPVLPFRHHSALVDQYLSKWFPMVALSVEGGLTTIVFLAAFLKKKLGPRR
ncbi:GerAB/ArcD/ProY family transporter [Paenibacillus sp. GYB003]|uniref:GerAB/ArcD/ProY family transporter n=1 Tax=Paenibacillus sp. GYB003 TaxID=2994392 RepID=UPI002F966A03